MRTTGNLVLLLRKLLPQQLGWLPKPVSAAGQPRAKSMTTMLLFTTIKANVVIIANAADDDTEKMWQNKVTPFVLETKSCSSSHPGRPWSIKGKHSI
jgi:hypothetical protein